MSILDKIVEATRRRVAAEIERVPPEHLRREALPSLRPFAFEKALRGGDLSFICEAKKASPSKGLIAPGFPYLDIAREYQAGGAAALSVLTEPDFFQGRDRYLAEIRRAVDIPVLRKDFILCEYQILQAARLGADAVLLICAILDDEQLFALGQAASRLGLSCLVEAHDEEEVRRALASGARIVGVNNRDLKTFQVDTGTSVRLRQLVPEDVVFVSESGITGPGDVETLRHAGVDAVLVGEILMRSPDRARALAELRGDPL